MKPIYTYLNFLFGITIYILLFQTNANTKYFIFSEVEVVIFPNLVTTEVACNSYMGSSNNMTNLHRK